MIKRHQTHLYSARLALANRNTLRYSNYICNTMYTRVLRGYLLRILPPDKSQRTQLLIVLAIFGIKNDGYPGYVFFLLLLLLFYFWRHFRMDSCLIIMDHGTNDSWSGFILGLLWEERFVPVTFNISDRSFIRRH